MVFCQESAIYQAERETEYHQQEVTHEIGSRVLTEAGRAILTLRNTHTSAEIFINAKNAV